MNSGASLSARLGRSCRPSSCRPHVGHLQPRCCTATTDVHRPRKPSFAPQDTCSTSGRHYTSDAIIGTVKTRMTEVAGATVLVSALGSMLLAGPCHAAAETLTGSSLDVFTGFLDYIESLGPWGYVIFVITVMFCEMVPLLPTTPLSLSGGLLFGADKGALLVLLGALLAAVNAFTISRGVGASLVQKVVNVEMGNGSGEKTGAAAKLAEVQAAIESGGFWSQFWSIALLRLTPVVPFSASNYILGLTPVQPGAFVLGTLLGSGVWSAVYASLGSASRGLLKDGDTEMLFKDLAEKSAAYSEMAGVLALTAGLVAAAYFGGTALLRSRRDALPPDSGSTSDVEPLAGGSTRKGSSSTPVVSTSVTSSSRTANSPTGGSGSPSGRSSKQASRHWLDTVVLLRKLRQQLQNR